ncbi:hypothetical protein [Paenibacillus sp. FSL K6-0108]|uniref:hypothetical protein n=1 Tax=Paenibacillus sp. FSL K6-0108 TaxID=2921417 RepID=UPI00324CC8CD
MIIIKKWKIGIILFFSVAMFIYYLKANYNINYYDESGYIHLSRGILDNGLFSMVNDLRTYLYPLIIAIISVFTDGDIYVIKIVVSILQYLLYCYTVIKLAKHSENYFKSKLVYYSILLFGLLNPYLIHATTLLLTDITASCCALLALISLMFGDFRKNRTYFMIFGFVYASVMIRPASIIFVPIVIFLLCVKNYMFKDVRMKISIISLLSLSIIFFPQLYNNVKTYNDWTPLLHADLYEFQSNLAASNLKYGTVVIPGEKAQLFFKSPFVEGTESGSIYSLIFTNFFAFVMTYFSHLFGVLDWGYIQTYISNFYPPSRILGSLFLYIFWLLGFLGLVLFLQRCVKGKEEKKGVFIGITLLSSFMIYWAFLGTTIIESRFGYPLYLLMMFFAAFGVKRFEVYVKNNGAVNLKRLSMILIAGVIFILSIFYVSFLLDYQTGRINWFHWFGL